MSKSGFLCALVAVLFLVQPGHAVTGVPDLSNSYAYMAYDGPGTPSLMVVPDGTGDSFTEAHDELGNVVDCTITLIVLDANNDPIWNFPFEDMWLESYDGAMVFCPGGTTADQNTDMNGMTYWSGPLFAGGYTGGPIIVLINGDALTTNPGLPLKINSPDNNGDLVVNLADVANFAGDYYTGYHFRSDLYGDGQINLADVPLLAQALTVTCP